MCGIFQLLFYKSLFAPDYDSAIVNDTELTKNTIWKLLNEIFELDEDASKKKKEKCSREKMILNSVHN